MTVTKIALYRASLVANNLGIRLCLAALLVMPSVLVLVAPVLALLGAPNDALLPAGLLRGGGAAGALLTFALGAGFIAAWLRIVAPNHRMLRRRGPRRLVVAALAVGVAAEAIDLALLVASPVEQDAGWLLLAALAVSLFLLAGTIGQARIDRLHQA
jgi:hypothetical protein